MVPPTTRVLAIRHGQTAWNADQRIQGQLDIGLNEVGRWQAGRLPVGVADEALAAVYASDLSRAFDTARPLAAAHGLAIVAEPALRERAFGVFEGLSFTEVEQRWPEQSLRWRKRDPQFGAAGGGETLLEFYARATACAERLAARHPGQTIALVTHGGVLDCLYRLAARAELQAPRTWQLGNASINRLLYSDGGFVLIGWSDTTHLDEPVPTDDRAIDAR
jgi:probable phosphoglycerate mutase